MALATLLMPMGHKGNHGHTAKMATGMEHMHHSEHTDK
jgi:hypothetical protein